ncbi:hypothetical protein J0895_24170 [Phormidium pseudopriestleyi FRX01]|uniref:Uncharacterized protein n=1 Tax=Phormidium pseudopriestleyi FRX01 TaxID=1759528 RepID=A0ABS3G0I8_9CYAN|nr:hypothetical protein [Phormidium pseudopriestleyi]MBO0352122.1 hypothetical protein [Phormidium pseudopriestleyi FRX01]
MSILKFFRIFGDSSGHLLQKIPQNPWIKRGIKILSSGRAIATLLSICPDTGADATKLNLNCFIPDIWPM